MDRRQFLKVAGLGTLGMMMPKVSEPAKIISTNIVEDLDRDNYQQRIEEYKDTMKGNMPDVFAQIWLTGEEWYRDANLDARRYSVEKYLESRPEFIIEQLDHLAKSTKDKMFMVDCNGTYREGKDSTLYLFQKMYDNLTLKNMDGNIDIPFHQARRTAYLLGSHSYTEDMMDGIGKLPAYAANPLTLNYVILGRQMMHTIKNLPDEPTHESLYNYILDNTLNVYNKMNFDTDSSIDCMLLKWHAQETYRRLPVARNAPRMLNAVARMYSKYKQCPDMNSHKNL